MIKVELQICKLIPYIKKIIKYIARSNINSRDDKEGKINDNEDATNEESTNIGNQILNEAKKVIKNKDENKVKEKIKNRIMRGNNNLKKNSNLDKEEGFQTSSKTLENPWRGK